MSLERYHDDQYLDLLRHVKYTGKAKKDRTNTGTISTFGYQMRFDISHNIIPLLTTKKMHLPAIFHELVWYLSGTGNIKYLRENGVRIWNEWADEKGDLGPVYGYQWRNWPKYEIEEFDNPSDEPLFYVTFDKVDQIANLIADLKNNPDSRRLMVNAWNVADLPDMKLPPCHYTFQFYTEEMTVEERIQWWRTEVGAGYNTETKATHEGLDILQVPRRWISCMLNQRSADVFLGVPFNISQYSVLTCLIGQIVGMAPKELIWTGGDCHIYDNLRDQVDLQLTRTPYKSPRLVINPAVDNIDKITYNDFSVVDYTFHPAIKGQVAV